MPTASIEFAATRPWAAESSPVLGTASPRATGSFLGTSEAMQEVFRLIDRVGPTDAAVLLTGESGSGKESAARRIHERSRRSGGPFVVVNCGAMPSGLIEAELFGVAGGDPNVHSGAFERAEGGTVLLDDVTEIPMDIQARLLWLLETGRYHGIGSNAESRCDVRVISSTSHCPLAAVASGRLREDLLYRLAVFPLTMPPLRGRGSDVVLLAEHFLEELNARHRTRKVLPAAARLKLRNHRWPGNVRELKSSVERAFVLADQVLDVAPSIPRAAAERPDLAESERAGLVIRVGSRLQDMERSLIEATLDYFKGNKRRAADALGCSLKTLYNKLNGYSQSRECASG